MHAIITRGLYIFTLFFTAFFYFRVVNITDNSCTKKVNSSFFKPKIRGLYMQAVTDQEWVIMAHMPYSKTEKALKNSQIPPMIILSFWLKPLVFCNN